MKGFVQDIEGLASRNVALRQVFYPAKNCPLVLMAMTAQEEIGAEVHHLDPFLRVEEGSSEAEANGEHIDGKTSE